MTIGYYFNQSCGGDFLFWRSAKAQVTSRMHFIFCACNTHFLVRVCVWLEVSQEPIPWHCCFRIQFFFLNESFCRRLPSRKEWLDTVQQTPLVTPKPRCDTSCATIPDRYRPKDNGLNFILISCHNLIHSLPGFVGRMRKKTII
jgi:hypothetical protein